MQSLLEVFLTILAKKKSTVHFSYFLKVTICITDTFALSFKSCFLAISSVYFMVRSILLNIHFQTQKKLYQTRKGLWEGSYNMWQKKGSVPKLLQRTL